jgi:putative DNA primase/helicase
METSVLGASTEAGLRQHLGSDAIPVLMDEAEQAQARDEERLQAVMELARASSSETGAKTLKGTASGTGQEYLIRSMFLLSSITSSLKQGSDKSRFALLQLRNPANDTPAEQVEHAKAWEQLRRDLADIDANTGKRLIARTVKRLPTLLREVALFSDACSEYFGSRRAGDQFGALMAGAFSLVSDEEATLETAAAFIGQHHWEEFLEPARDAADHERCLNRILESRVRVSGTDSEIPMGELLEIQLNRVLNAEITSKRASELMQRSGLKVVNGRLIVSANHTAIAKILEKTPWSNDWRTVLKQIPGAEVTGSTYFTGGHQSRGVSLPIAPNARDS